MLKKMLPCLLSVLILFSIVFTSPVSTVYAQVDELGGANLGFESNLDGWQVNGNVTIQADSGKSGNYVLMRAGSSLSKTITGIPQGSYTVSMWVKGATSSNTANLAINDTGGPDSVLKIDTLLDSSTWREISHRNVLIYNGQMTVNVNAGTSSGLQVDEVVITLDSNDNNPVYNWDFEEGLQQWGTKGEVTIDTSNADTGVNAVKLADQSEVSQIVSVKPDTDYVATVRMKVDEEDAFKSTKQYNLSETSVFGVLVERESLGNRVNLGVRGTDGVVLRQAPASTEGYALVTIAFHTGANQTEAELYANTIFDQNYIDSVTVYENKLDNNPYPNGWQRPNYEETDNTHPADDWNSNGNQFAYVDNVNVFEISNDYIKGADMSYLQIIEDAGGKYFANGVQQDALRILSNHGVNSILTTIWVKAGNPVYDWNTLTPLSSQTLGYNGEAVTGRQVVTGYFGKKHSVAFGKRATELHMTYTPSFHYSDTWISAAKAHMPYEWIEKDYDGKLSNPDIQMLETAVYNYVHDTLTEMKTEGVHIISVKHGNEQDGGLLFPVASGSQYNQHAAIVTASTRAAKEIYPGAINTIHTNTGYNAAQISSFFQANATRGAEFDGMAFSLYGGRETTGQFVMMNAAMQNNATKYYDYINVETGFTFTRESPISDTESTMALTQYYNATPNGQYNFLLDYIQAPLDIPNPYGTTRGFYYWNAEPISIYGAGHKAGETAGGSKRILFNNGTESIKEMGSSYNGKAGDMMDSMFAFLHRGHTKKASDTVYNPLRFNGTNYDIGGPTDLSFQNDNLSLQAGEVGRLQPTIAPVDKLLNDYKIHYTSDNPDVAEVSDYGFVAGRSAGTALITATIGSISKSVTVTVHESDKATGISITYEVIRGRSSVDTGTISPGSTINAKPFDKIKFKTVLSGNPSNKAVEYKVSEPEIARWYGDTWETDDRIMRTLADKLSTSNYEPIVQLNPARAGTVSITAAADDGTAAVNFNVAVTQTDVTDISINQGDRSIRAGKSLQLTASITPNDASFYKVYWSSDDENIAKVDSKGWVTAINPGEATIKIVSDSNPAITDTIALTVTDVLVEQLLLSNSKIGLLAGDSKTLVHMSLPDNAVNKEVVWSVKPGDEGIISVDQNGTVTGLQAGTGTVMVTSTDGSHVTAECVVTVVNQSITATGMELSANELWIKSNYFSPDSSAKGDRQPINKLEARFAPEEATNTDVFWSSNNEAIASVDANGFVTTHKPGVAVITAESLDGGFTESATVYVPHISEDWENYEVGSKGGFTDSNTFTYEVVDAAGDQKMQAAVKSQRGGENPPTLNRRAFTPVSGDQIVVDFDWNVGSFTPDNRSRGANVSIEDANGNTYLALAAFPAVSGTDYEMTYYMYNGSTAMPTKKGDVNGNYNYIHGGGGAGGTYSDTANVGKGLKGAKKDYNVRAVLNFKTRTISFTVTDKHNPSITSTVSGLAMDSRVNYSNSFGAVAFSHYFNSLASWTTTIDNLAVYTTSIQPEKIEFDVKAINMNESEGIKLVPVENALSATAKINARVLPSAADQNMVFTPLGELADVLSIEPNGTITVNPTSLVNYGDYEAIQSAAGFIRVSSVSAPEVYKDVKLTIGGPNASEVVQVYADGEEYFGPVMLALDATPRLTFTATGGDGTSDIYSYNWQVTSGNAQIDANGELSAETVGNVTVTFTVDFFRKQEVRTLEFSFIELPVPVTGVRVSPTELILKVGGNSQLAATVAPANATNQALIWSSSHSDVAEVSASGLVTAKHVGTVTITVTTKDGSFTATTEVTVDALQPSVVPVTGVSVSPTELTLKVGGTSQLGATVAPANATDQALIWSSSHSDAAEVSASGLVIAKQAGTATITATTEDGSFIATTQVTVQAAPSGNNGSSTGDGAAPKSNLDIIDGKGVWTAALDEDGNVKVQLTEADMDSIVKQSRNGVLHIHIVSETSNNSMELTMPVQRLLEGEETFSTIVIEYGPVWIEIAVDEASKILSEGSRQLNFTMHKVDVKSLSADSAAIIGKHPVYDFNLLVDGHAPIFANNVTVKVTYALQAGETPSGIVVYYVDDSGKLNVVKNSHYDAETTEIVFQPQHFSRYAIAYVPSLFEDMESATWAREMIESLVAKEIIGGVSTYSFQPGRSVTRAEFLKMILNALDLTSTRATAAAFEDVTTDHWYYDVVSTGYQLGIVYGKSNKQFRANDAITREDMAVMLYRAIQLAGTSGFDQANNSSTFSDQSTIARYALQAVESLQAIGIVNGFEDGAFGPEQLTSRAQAAVVVYRLLSL
ncbi:Ig-like domain-containing protein [Paenibacillus sp. LHD-38]|uniref:Ig-like domain-containing protein n=1 Tax=Paenibacillus sp. LHD-38 TaxID=3072143 RepID=UPI00281061B3|nr:Ig-like domain-containing protein [Paenibacillus sp. LHD-38]MDQ8734751.1 Ig-like domain-containing protein [Paenibacillus sp. LHD-38]